MRKLSLTLAALAVIGAALWGGYWFAGARVMEKALNGWLADRRAEGWVAEADSLATHGFPNRFDTTFEGLRLADPETQVGWSAPLFQILSLSYKPNHMIAVWPGRQVLQLPEQSLTVEAETMHGSFIVTPGPSLPVQTSTTEIVGATIASTRGWTATLGRGQLSMRETPDSTIADTYDFAVLLSELAPGEDFLSLVRGVSNLPETIGAASIEATIGFNAPWDRYAIERERPQPRHVTLDALSAEWGALRLAAQGDFDVDQDGVPAGEVEIKATNWREMIAVANAAGALSDEWANRLTRALEIVARLNGDPETLQVTLGFRNGLMFLGAVPIGVAPLLQIP